MIIRGQFRDIDNSLITVIFTKDDGSEQIIEIGEDIVFAGDPITITTNNDDLFNVIIRKSAKISLLTTSYVGNLFFADNSRSVKVEIKKGNSYLFYGYVDPNTYNQPYSSPLDDFEVNCIDVLSTLQYYNYKNANLTNYPTIKNAAANVTIKSILDLMFTGLDVTLYYDKSKGISSNKLNTVFNDISVSEQIIVGEEFDDIWTYEECLESLLKYLNLHIVQHGKNIYIFDWDSIKNKNTSWLNLSTNTSTTLAAVDISITSDMHADNGTQITIDDVYNQISVKCNLDSQDTVITSPLEKDSLTSLYSGKQLYMTEYISEGSGNHANSAFNAIVKGRSDNYADCKTVDWFIQAMNNKNWKFYYDGVNVVDSLAEQSNGRYINQWKLAKYLRTHSCVPYIFKFGSVEHKGSSVADNSPISKVDMKPYLFISINGNETSNENTHAPSDATIQSHSGMAEYVANNSGGVFSPIDDDTINYLVFSGRLLFQPIQYESSTSTANKNNNFEAIRVGNAPRTEGSVAQVPRYDELGIIPNNLIKSDNNGEGRYYTRKFWTQINPTDKPLTYLTDGSANLQPWTSDKSAKGYEYKYSAEGQTGDLYAKLPILECELIIGNKRLVEEDIDEYGNSTFKWYELGHEPTVTVDGQTYTLTTFSIGVNPKLNDFIIGQEYDIQNTIDYTMNVDAEGTAIPIKKSDNISGAVIFRILGPINLLWNQVTRRHPSFWRHTQWSSDARFILAHTENIIIEDFECKVYTNSGLNDITEDNELIYMSDETDNYINKKDDIDFDFITQLSSAECLELGIKQAVNMNAVINTSTNLPLATIYNKWETVPSKKNSKAEEHYINQYYNNYSSPKIRLDTNLHITNVDWKNVYTSTALNKQFITLAEEFDVRNKTKNLTLREI